MKWWKNESTTFRDGALVDEATYANLPLAPIPAERLPGYRDRKPVFFGHYWLKGGPVPQSDRVACLDYSIAKGDKLCAYRWDGEPVLRSDRFAWVAMPYAKLETAAG